MKCNFILPQLILYVYLKQNQFSQLFHSFLVIFGPFVLQLNDLICVIHDGFQVGFVDFSSEVLEESKALCD